MKVSFGKRSDKHLPPIRLALDIGTEYAKALVVQGGEDPTLLGVGRTKQSVGHMEDGAVAHISGVVACCRKAIEQAYSVAGHAPIEAVIGVAAEHVHGAITRIQFRRRRPNRPIGEREFLRLIEKAKEEARRQAIASFHDRTGLRSIDLQLLNANLIDVKIDGFKVRSPEQFKGTHVELVLFHTFSPLVHIGALQTIANELGIVMLQSVAEPYAVAKGVLGSATNLSDAMIIDIGGGSTDLAVVRDGTVINTQSLAIGGRSFTRSLANHFSIDLKKAESIKLDYSARLLDDSLSERISRLFEHDIQIFQEALKLGFGKLAEATMLPTNVYVCGGGASLPGIQDTLASTAWPRQLFNESLQVFSLTPSDITRLSDPDLHLSGIADVTPKSLAVQAALFGTTPSILGIGVDGQLDLSKRFS